MRSMLRLVLILIFTLSLSPAHRALADEEEEWMATPVSAAECAEYEVSRPPGLDGSCDVEVWLRSTTFETGPWSTPASWRVSARV